MFTYLELIEKLEQLADGEVYQHEYEALALQVVPKANGGYIEAISGEYDYLPEAKVYHTANDMVKDYSHDWRDMAVQYAALQQFASAIMRL